MSCSSSVSLGVLACALFTTCAAAQEVQEVLGPPGEPPVVADEAATGTQSADLPDKLPDKHSDGQPEPETSKPVDRDSIDLSQLETDNLSLLYFDPAQTYLTPYLARSFEKAIQFHRELFDWEPWDRTTVLLKDFSDYGNAAARSSPNNAILFDVAPLGLTFETFSPGERFFTLTNHELAHVATMDVWNSRDARWRKFFRGKPMPVQEHPVSILYNYLATPRVNVPRWYLEGSAVFMETWMAGGLGRAQGAYDEMVFRSKVRDGARLYSPVGLESEGVAVDFQVGVNDYLYGTRFFSYLALTYSPEKVIEWLKRDENSAAFYATQFRRVFGKRVDDAWQDWIRWEHDFQRRNLAKLNAYPLTQGTRLTSHGLGSVSRTFYDAHTNSLVGAFRYPGVIGHIGSLSLDTGEIARLQDIKGPMLYMVTSMAFDPDRRKIYYTEDNYALRDLLELDLATGKRRMLLRDARIGDLVLNPTDKSLWGFRHLNGYVTLVRVPQPYAGFNQIHTFDYGQVPYDLDISADGSLISASFGEIDGQQSVRVWRVEDLVGGGGLNEVARLKLGSSTPESFVFAPDGRSLYGSAYYTGVSNIYRFDIASQAFEAVSNASSGFFRPTPQADGSLIVFEYTGEGLIPVRINPSPVEEMGTIGFLGTRIAKERPIVRQWGVGSPAGVKLEELITRRGKYDPARESKLAAAYPVLEGYKSGVAVGYHAVFEDPMQLRQIKATVTVSPVQDLSLLERLHVDLEYRGLNWRFRYWHNDADFYDLFGPVQRSRKGDAILAGYEKALIYDPPRQLEIFADGGLFVGLEKLPEAQNVSTGFSTLAFSQAGVRYTNTTRSLGAVDHEKGMRANFAASAEYASGSVFPKLHAGFDFGRPIALRNSSLWLYSSAGIAGGDRNSPLGSFYFGSFGNNYVDNREVKRYREFDSFPGFDINEIDARRFAKAIGEWNLPPVRFSDVGTPTIFLSSLRPALFAGVLVADQRIGGMTTYQTAGFQIDSNFTVAFRLPMVLSLGVSSGFEDGRYRGTELLGSLKIM